MEEPGGGWKGERVAVRVEVEEFPLKAAPIPPCRLQSIAITRGSDVGSFVLFIGTESGHLLRYQLSSLASTAQASSPPPPPPPPPPQSSPLTASPGGSPNASGTFTNDRTNVSPGDILQQLPNLPAAAASDSTSALLKLPGRERNGVSSPHLHSHPLIRQSQQSHSRLPDHDNGGAQTSHPADPLTNLPSSSPLPSASSVADQKVGGGKPETGMVLTHSKHVSRSPIEALCPLPECGRIAILSDAHIALLDLNSLSIRHRLPETKGTLTMSRGLDSSLPIPYPSSFMLLEGPPDRGSRALATRNESMNKLFARGRLTSKLGGLVGGLDKAFSPGRGDVESRRKDGAGRNSTATARGFLGRQAGGTGKGLSRLAVAMKKKIILFEIRPSETDNSEEGEGLMARREQSNGFHCMKVRDVSGIEGVVTMAWLGDVIIAGTRHEYLLFSLTSGLPTHLFSLPQEVPWQPLLKAFPKNREALLLIDNAGIPINTEGHPAGGSLLFQMLPDGIGSSPPYVLVAKQGVVEVYHHRTGSKLQSFALTDGGKGRSLVADDEDGTFIVVANSFKVWCLRQVPLDEQLKELLKRKEFADAERLAEEAQPEGDGDSTKTRLAMVHAEAGFLHLFDLQFVEAMEQFLLSDIMEPSELFPFFPSLTSRWRAMVPPKRYWGLHPPPQAMRMVIESGLLAIQSGLLKAPVLVANGSAVGDIFVGSKSGKDAMVERYLIHAMENVARYLHIIREKRQLKMLEKEGVDTLLVKLYTELKATSDLNELAASSNQCVLEEVEGLLKGAGQLHALALLYESKGLWNSALQVWQTLAHTPGSPTRSPYGNVSGEPEQWLATKQGVAVNEAVRLLEQSSDTDLVLQHIHWIMKLDQNLALSILTSSKRTEPLSPEDTLLALDSDGGMVQQRYLLWLVEEQGLGDSFYHTELALSLAKSAVSSLERSSRIVEESDGSSTAPLAKDDASQSSSEPQQLVDSATKSIRKNPRDVLLTFLETSDGYDAKMVLDVIKDSQLWKEQFVLHRKLGDEISALRTLALKLEDSGAAERYCAEIGRPDAYLELMEMYLHPGEGREPMHRAAVRLLHCHGASLDPLQVLEALSLEMPLGSASETIAQLMVARVHRRRQGQIVRQLVRKENLEARIARVEERSRNVSIRPDSTCGSCGARIGTKLFALYPDDSVFCYKCLRRFGENARPASQHWSDKGSRPAVDPSL